MRYLLLIGAVAALASCGSTAERGAMTSAAPPAGQADPQSRSPELVFFQRNGGLAATLDTVSVRADGATRADKRYGGAGRRYEDFRLAGALLRRLRSDLARLPARVPDAGPGRAHADTYLLRYRGRTLAAQEGAVPRALRPAMRTLNAIVDGSGRPASVHEVRQAPT